MPRSLLAVQPRLRHARRRVRRGPFVVRLASLGLVAASIGGLVLTTLPGTSAPAVGDSGSELTIAWAGDTSSAAAYQPERDSASPHYSDFKNLTLTVSQTRDVVDQAITVSVSGFSATQSMTDGAGRPVDNAMNFLQAMQCWGPDPLADDFYQTCQWGGRYANNNGLGNSVYPDNVPRVAESIITPSVATDVDVPFRTFGGTLITGRQVCVDPAANPRSCATRTPLLDYMNPSTTNEVQSARVGRNGTGAFDFELQSDDQAPQLGCGEAGHERCWLVVVPRGTKYGGQDSSCSNILDSDAQPYTYGRANSIQAGSPVNPDCDYWKNRIAVPLDFAATGAACAVGSAEQRLVGSQLMVQAMSSWQPALCQQIGVTYSFSTNPDATARTQLLGGQAGLAFTSFPIREEDLLTEIEQERFEDADLYYAPVAVTAPVFAFLREGSEGRTTSLNLSPRLVAKMLTQSYTFLVPGSAEPVEKKYAHLAETNRGILYLNQDPEFQQLNPTNWQQFSMNPAIVLPGPSNGDALRQVWRWVLADHDARQWLSGKADEAGMKVNPYYLPAGHPDARVPVFDENGEFLLEDGEPVFKKVGLTQLDGSPMRISETTLDYFLKSDESQAPLNMTVETYRFGSLQYAPYAETLLTAARDTFRADPHAKTVWDSTRINPSGTLGDWVSAGTQLPGQKFMISVTDAASAARLSLNTAALRVADGDTLVQPGTEGMEAALTALRPVDGSPITQIDPDLVDAGYPLTTVVYAAINLPETTPEERNDYVSLLDNVANVGQLPGTALGRLPAGYLPIGPEFTAQTNVIVQTIAAFAPPPSPTPTPVPVASVPAPSNNGPAQDGWIAPADASGADLSGSASAPFSVTESEAALRGRTAETEGTIAQVVLGGSLVVGVAGLLLSPLLFRGRRL